MGGVPSALLVIVGLLGAGYFLLMAGDVVNTNASPQVSRIAIAIATAEGFFVAGSRPQRNNNPGDMTQDLIGRGVGKDGAFVVYSTAADGWANLYAQINKWLVGHSAWANSDSTISDISQFYTADNQSNWAINVANSLGVTVDTPIGEIA